MYKDKKILAIITARGGSKGLPRKNIKNLLGKPLIAWTLESAKKCPHIDKIFVSTDSQEIADMCEKFGVSVPSLRPAHLAEDKTSSVDVINYVLKELERSGEEYDYIMLLQPTSPMRKKDDLKNIIEKLLNNPKQDAIITLGEVCGAHPLYVKKISHEGKMEAYVQDTRKIHQRQQLDKAYFSYGVVYFIKTDVYKKNNSLFTDDMDFYLIERWQCFDIDDIYDFMCVETIMKTKLDEIG